MKIARGCFSSTLKDKVDNTAGKQVQEKPLVREKKDPVPNVFFLMSAFCTSIIRL